MYFLHKLVSGGCSFGFSLQPHLRKPLNPAHLTFNVVQSLLLAILKIWGQRFSCFYAKGINKMSSVITHLLPHSLFEVKREDNVGWSTDDCKDKRNVKTVPTCLSHDRCNFT